MKSKNDPTPKTPGASAPRRLRLEWTHGLVFLLGVALTLVVRSVVVHPSASRAAPSERTEPPVSASRPPWGHLEITEMELCRPPRPAPDPLPPPAPLAWHFEGLAERQVEELIESCELSPAQKLALRDKARWRQTETGWALSPPIEVVRELSTSARQRLYGVLSHSSSNPFHRDPFRFEPATFEAWLAQSGLTEEHQALFRQLSYPLGGLIAFSDIALLEHVCSRDELVQLDRSIARTPALLVKVRINSPDDVEPLLAYWNRHGQCRAQKPLLESLARVPGGVAISVSALFPPFARRRLYTFPDPVVDDPRQDCFWTAMNFFHDPPDRRFLDWRHTREVLRTQYQVVTNAPQFGDLWTVVDDQERALHMCVHVADDVVFTKNGAGWLQPWVLMRLSGVTQRYAYQPQTKLVRYRRLSP